jgi:hypothetical protein
MLARHLHATLHRGAAVKKGRHRRFEEARALKESRGLPSLAPSGEPCAECGAKPGTDHASWCLAGEDDLDEDLSSSEG